MPKFSEGDYLQYKLEHYGKYYKDDSTIPSLLVFQPINIEKCDKISLFVVDIIDISIGGISVGTSYKCMVIGKFQTQGKYSFIRVRENWVELLVPDTYLEEIHKDVIKVYNKLRNKT